MKVREIAELLEGELSGDGEVEISGIAALGTARSGDLAFSIDPVAELRTEASCVIVPANYELKHPFSYIRVADPKLAFAKIAASLRAPTGLSGWHDSASVSDNSAVEAAFIGAFVSIGKNASIEPGVEIHSGSQIGRDVKIGIGTIIYPNCVVYDGAVIGRNCIVHSGTVIGADGFGYVLDTNGDHVKFPQAGTVVIEDNVEIGANSCIDRGSLGETRIGEGTKIDNLVQIAHNVRIGKRCIIASLSGISGSSVLEDDVLLAGQVGIADHVVLKSGVIIGAKSAVFPNKVIRAGFWCGIPVQRIDDYKRQHAMLKSLGRLNDKVRELNRRLDSKNT